MPGRSCVRSLRISLTSGICSRPTIGTRDHRYCNGAHGVTDEKCLNRIGSLATQSSRLDNLYTNGGDLGCHSLCPEAFRNAGVEPPRSGLSLYVAQW